MSSIKAGLIFGFAVFLAGGISMADEIFEIEAPKRFVGPIKLKDGRLFGIDRSFTGLCSADGGRTWKQSGPLVDQKGKTFRKGTRPWSLIRLQSGAIGITYETIPPSQAGRIGPRYGTFFRESADEGKTWSAPARVSWANTPANPTWLIQTKNGRLLLPNEYWYTQPGDRGMGICTMFYSDDEGKTWRESPESLFAWEKDGAVIGGAEVPCVAETADGKLLMFMRTELQRIAQSYSTDGGVHWSPVTLNSLPSSRSEVWLAQIPTTGDLLCVWNQASTQEIKTGYYRARLTSAISKDSGKTWENFRTVAMSPGQEKVTRITNDTPPSHLKSIGAVPSKELTATEGFHMNRAPRVKFVGDKAYIVYTHRIYKYPGEKFKCVYNQDKLRVLPISWFYKKEKTYE